MKDGHWEDGHWQDVPPLHEGLRRCCTHRASGSNLKGSGASNTAFRSECRAVTNGEYTGHWLGGERHGEGIMLWDDGDTYEGQFVHDKRNGQGKYTYVSGNVYEGSWVDDKKHGHGTYLWTSGSKYTGEYKDDKKHGVGLMVRSNGNRQEGNFEKDRFMGQPDVKAPSPPSSPRASSTRPLSRSCFAGAASHHPAQTGRS
jgi:hypothetical protein